MPQPQPKPSELIIKSLYNELTRLHQELTPPSAGQSLGREGVMEEEHRALPVFFRPNDGIYARLLEKYPEFVTNPSKAENDTIISIINKIVEILAQSKDRLNYDKEVGPQVAAQAASDPTKRYRREHPVGGECRWDDIGRCHSALRMLLDDNTLSASNVWTTRYFDGNSGFLGHSYRHYLALIWRGLTEQYKEAPINFAGLPLEQLQAMAVEQFISVLAQCRREHNFDCHYPDWYQEEKPQDAQRCDIGLRGDLFGQLLMYNENYVQTRANFNVELLGELIRDIILEQFTGLELKQKELIMHYLDNKAALVDPEEQETDALNYFIQKSKLVVLTKLTEKLQNVPKDTPLYNISHFIQVLREKTKENNNTARLGLPQIMTYLYRWVNAELESLQMLGATNLASMDYIRRFAENSLPEVFRTQLVAALSGNTDARQQLATQLETLNNQVYALEYRLDERVVLDVEFPEARRTKDNKEKKQQYLQLIQFYQDKVSAMQMQITELSKEFATNTQMAMSLGLTLMGDKEIANTITKERQKFVQNQEKVLQAINEKLVRINELMKIEDGYIYYTRPYIQSIFHDYPGNRRFTPDFYAEYIWRLLLEKTPGDNYFIDTIDEAGFRRTLDLIFGNADQGIMGLDPVQQTLIMYAFNAKLQSKMADKSLDAKTSSDFLCCWRLVESYLKEKQIFLGDADVTPSKDVLTLIETGYQASKLPSSLWRIIIERSGKQTELEQTIEIPPGAEQKGDWRQQPRYPEQIISRAASLPLSRYNVATADIPKREQALVLWRAVAMSIYQNVSQYNDENINALINFVTQSIMMQLGINKFAREDQIVIEHIVKEYLGIQTYKNFPLLFEPRPEASIDVRINCLAVHLSIMLTTLSAPAVKTSFAHGMLRLMSREDAEARIKAEDKYIIRLSNQDPNCIKISYRDAKGINSHPPLEPSAAQHTQVISFHDAPNKTFKIHTFPGNTLETMVYPKIAIILDLNIQYPICMLPGVNDKNQELKPGVIYLDMANHTSLKTLVYKMKHPSGKLLSGTITIPDSIRIDNREYRSADNREYRCDEISLRVLIEFLNDDKELQKSLILSQIRACKDSIVPNQTLGRMTDVVVQAEQAANFDRDIRKAHYESRYEDTLTPLVNHDLEQKANTPPSLIPPVRRPKGLKKAIKQFDVEHPEAAISESATTAQRAKAADTQKDPEQKSEDIMQGDEVIIHSAGKPGMTGM